MPGPAGVLHEQIVAALLPGLVPEPAVTGHHIAVLRTDGETRPSTGELVKSLSVTGPVATSSDFGENLAAMGPLALEAATAGAGALLFEKLDVAFIVNRGDASAMSTASLVQALEIVEDVYPDFYLYPISSFEERRLQWLREAAALLLEGDIQAGPVAPSGIHPSTPIAYADDLQSTWGLKATGADASTYTGAGITIMVIDTGFATEHPDFIGRSVTPLSFIDGEAANDVAGHGTHCAGIAAGPRTGGGNRPGYGVAPNAELISAKVFDRAGRASTPAILAAIESAIGTAEIVSMSIGAAVKPGIGYNPVYERVARRALDQDVLVVAAAGNNSRRDLGFIAPVNMPANCPSILAVAAVDQSLATANFSAGGINQPNGGKDEASSGGEVDLAAPGTEVLSSIHDGRVYAYLSGTSMATPHVAGVAALWAESDASLRGRTLMEKLLATAIPLRLHQRDVGRGLVVAP